MTGYVVIGKKTNNQCPLTRGSVFEWKCHVKTLSGSDLNITYKEISEKSISLTSVLYSAMTVMISHPQAVSR